MVFEQFLKLGVEGAPDGHLSKQCSRQRKSPRKDEVGLCALFMSPCQVRLEENGGEQKMEVKIHTGDWNTQGPLSYCETDGKIVVEYKQEYCHLNVLKQSLWLL